MKEIPVNGREYSVGGKDLSYSTEGNVVFPDKFKNIKTSAVEKKSPEENLTDSFQQLVEQKPPAKEVIEQGQKEGKSFKEIMRAVERIGTREELQTTVIKQLENTGIAERGPQGEIIIDLPSFVGKDRRRREWWNLLRNNHSFREGKFKSYKDHGRHYVLYYAFQDLPVISRTDWQKDASAAPAKSLFYSPRGEDEAFDIEAIKQSDFHLGLWEISNQPNISSSYYPLGNEKASFSAVTIACSIYHPKFGNGYRDQNGNLMVRQRNGAYQKISNEWSKKGMSFSGTGEFFFSPQRYLAERGQKLLEHGLLKKDDFISYSHTNTAEKYGVHRGSITRTGIMLDRVRYFLGRKIAREAQIDQDLRIYPLAGKFGLIVKGDDADKKIQYIFKLVRPDDPRLKRMQSDKGDYYDAGIKISQPEEYQADKFTDKEIKDFENLLNFSNDLFQANRLEVLNLPLKERGALSDYINSSDGNYQNLLRFAKEHGRQGLQSFLSAEQKNKMGAKVLAIAENLDRTTAQAVFDKFFAIVDAARTAGGYLRDAFSVRNDYDSSAVEKITSDLLTRAEQVLQDFNKQVQTSKLKHTKLTSRSVLRKLEDIKINILLFANTFKTASAEGRVDLTEVRGVEIESKDSADLSDREKFQLRRIFRDNRLEISSEFAAYRLKEEFDPVLGQAGHKFYLLKKDGQVISFARFDQLPNGNLYTGFINTAPDIRGMNIGTAFLKTALEKEGRRKDIELKVRVENPAVRLYKRLGFAIDGQPFKDEKTDKEYFKMIRPADQAER